MGHGLRLVISCSGMAGLCLVAAVDAAPQQVFIEEVQVTAQKRSQDLLDVPIAITAFSGQALSDLGVDNFEYLSDFIPGVRIQEQSVTTSGFSIRGITSDTGAATQQPRVSVFQNGVDISRSRGANIALYDIERIEALKGPQGTLFGRGAEIGALSIVQNKADFDSSGSVTAGVGDYGERQLTGFVNGTLIDDTLAGRAAVYYRKRDGYIDNIAGGSLSGVDTQAMRLSLRWTPSDTQVWDLVLNYQNDTPPGTGFESFYFAEADAFEDANLDAGSGLKIDRQAMDVTLSGEVELSSKWSLSSLSAYRKFDAIETFDADGFSLPILELDDHVEHEQWSQELRLNYSDETISGFTGINVYREEGRQTISERYHEGYLVLLPKVQSFLVDPSAPFDNALLQTPPPVFEAFAPLASFLTIPLNSQLQESQTATGKNLAVDLFGDISYEVNDKLNLTAGVRISYEDVRSELDTPEAASSAGLSFTTCGGLFLQPVCESGILVSRNLSQEDHFWGVSGRLVLDYHIDEQWSSYASYARGRRPDVLDYTGTSRENNQDEELVDSFEVGAKYRSQDQRYAMDMAAFYYDYRNFVTAQPGNTPILTTDDNGEATTSGVEFSGSAALSDSWSSFVNLAYIDSRIDDKSEFNFAGDRFRLSPLWSSALGVSARTPLQNLGEGIFTLTYTFQSEIQFEDNNSSNPDADGKGQNRQGGYGLWNARFSLDNGVDNWRVDLWVNNLLDKEYIIDAGNTGDLFGLPTSIPGRPRMWGASLSLDF